MEKKNFFQNAPSSKYMTCYSLLCGGGFHSLIRDDKEFLPIPHDGGSITSPVSWSWSALCHHRICIVTARILFPGILIAH